MKALLLSIACLNLTSCYTMLYMAGLEEKNERKAEAEIMARTANQQATLP